MADVIGADFNLVPEPILVIDPIKEQALTRHLLFSASSSLLDYREFNWKSNQRGGSLSISFCSSLGWPTSASKVIKDHEEVAKVHLDKNVVEDEASFSD